MIVYNDIEQLPDFRNAVITVGTFDGVHTGHQQIIHLMTEEAAEINGETVIITFHPHPRKIISTGQTPLFLLNTLEEKISLLGKYGIDYLVVIPFTEAFSNLTADQYIRDFLVKTFHPNKIIIGHDHHFGKDRAGNYLLLEEKAHELKYKVKEIPEYMVHNNTISSTKIRTALQQGDIETANAYLGYDYFFNGTVMEGNKLGRTIGYPTANLGTTDENKLIPGNGVYAVTVKLSPPDNIFQGMMNIGIRPTVDGSNRVIEVNIFDFDKDIYGRILTITIMKYLRNEQKFEGLEGLKVQLAMDKLKAIEALGKN